MCMGRDEAVIELTGEERDELTRWSRSRTLPAGDVFKDGTEPRYGAANLVEDEAPSTGSLHGK